MTDEVASDSCDAPSEENELPVSCTQWDPLHPDSGGQIALATNLATGIDPTDMWTDLAPEPSCEDILNSDFEVPSTEIHQQFPIPNPLQGISFLPLAADEEKWDVSNNAFTRALQSATSLLDPDQVDPDVPLKAIFSGWHTIEPHERDKPIWTMLRTIDERVFGLWTSKAQKLALMYITHTLIKVGLYITHRKFTKKLTTQQ